MPACTHASMPAASMHACTRAHLAHWHLSPSFRNTVGLEDAWASSLQEGLLLSLIGHRSPLQAAESKHTPGPSLAAHLGCLLIQRRSASFSTNQNTKSLSSLPLAGLFSSSAGSCRASGCLCAQTLLRHFSRIVLKQNNARHKTKPSPGTGGNEWSKEGANVVKSVLLASVHRNIAHLSVGFARGVLARRSSLPRVEFTSPQCLRLHAFAAASGDSTERSRGCGTSEEACGLFGLSLYVRAVAAVSTNMRLGADWLGGGESQRLARRPSSAQIACRCLSVSRSRAVRCAAQRCTDVRTLTGSLAYLDPPLFCRVL